MRVFMTGATGYIGNAVAVALRRRGHDVAALVRPQSEAGSLRDAGVVVMQGDLEGLPAMRPALETFDAFIHTAASTTATVALDRAAIDAFSGVSGKLFIYTSGVWVLGNCSGATEETSVQPLEIVKWRPEHESLVLEHGGCVLRPGCVYGGRQSMCRDWFAAIEQNEPVRLVGDGKNRWSMVDLTDLAECYALTLEQQATGVLHAVDDTRDSLEDCVSSLAEGVRVGFVPPDAVRADLGAFTDALLVDQVIHSALTRKKLGWLPGRTFVGSVAEQWSEWRAVQTS